MLRYLAKRLFFAILVLLVVSVLTFFMSTLAPGDRVEAHLSIDGAHASFKQQSFSERKQTYRRTTERLGLHLPLFYVTIHPRTFPDTLHRILRKDERQTLKQLLYRHGSWDQVLQYRNSALALIYHLEASHSDSSALWSSQMTNDTEFLLTTSDTGRITYLLNAIVNSPLANDPSTKQFVEHLTEAHATLNATESNVWSLMPAMTMHGSQNQYHQWIAKTISGNLGTSLIDGRPVSTKIREALRWTLNMNVIAILLAFGISIPLGVATARRAGKLTDKTVSTVLFSLYAVPSFWLAMLCIVFLSTSEYGSWLDWFPTSGVGIVNDQMTLIERIGIRVSHLILPVFCVTAGSIAYLTRQMRGSMLRELRQDYIRMARAKGLSEDVIHWRHAFRNALFPMITMVGSAFPAAISGSVILEVIFSIPGMGRLLYMSILSRDWPVVYAMVLLAAVLTVIGYFIADLLYRWADPRVELERRRR